MNRVAVDDGNQQGGVMRVLRLSSLVGVLVLAGTFATLGDSGKPAGEKSMSDQVKDAIQLFKSDSKTITKLFDTAYGYAVLPSVGKGAAGIGAAHGKGQVFESGSLIGDCEMTQI